MDFTFHNKLGTITISKEIVNNAVKDIVSTLSLYEVEDIKFGKDIKGLYTFYIYLKNNHSFINYIDYMSTLQTKLERSISASLGITNCFLILILN